MVLAHPFLSPTHHELDNNTTSDPRTNNNHHPAATNNEENGNGSSPPSSNGHKENISIPSPPQKCTERKNNSKAQDYNDDDHSVFISVSSLLLIHHETETGRVGQDEKKTEAFYPPQVEQNGESLCAIPCESEVPVATSVTNSDSAEIDKRTVDCESNASSCESLKAEFNDWQYWKPTYCVDIICSVQENEKDCKERKIENGAHEEKGAANYWIEKVPVQDPQPHYYYLVPCSQCETENGGSSGGTLFLQRVPSSLVISEQVSNTNLLCSHSRILLNTHVQVSEDKQELVLETVKFSYNSLFGAMGNQQGKTADNTNVASGDGGSKQKGKSLGALLKSGGKGQKQKHASVSSENEFPVGGKKTGGKMGKGKAPLPPPLRMDDKG